MFVLRANPGSARVLEDLNPVYDASVPLAPEFLGDLCEPSAGSAVKVFFTTCVAGKGG
jgi:hypothetical protein